MFMMDELRPGDVVRARIRSQDHKRDVLTRVQPDWTIPLPREQFIPDTHAKMGDNLTDIRIVNWPKFNPSSSPEPLVIGYNPPYMFCADSYATEEFFTDAKADLRYTMKGRVVKDTLRAYRECRCPACQKGPDYLTPMGLANHNLIVMMRRLNKFQGVK